MVSKDELEDSILYQPVGAIAPMILPRFIDEKTILELPQFEDSEEQ